MEPSGTSEAARAVFEDAVKSLAAPSSTKNQTAVLPMLAEVGVPQKDVDLAASNNGGPLPKRSGTTAKVDVVSGSNQGQNSEPEKTESSVPGGEYKRSEPFPLEETSGSPVHGVSQFQSPTGTTVREAERTPTSGGTSVSSVDNSTSIVVVAALPKVSETERATAALASLLRGLESRFLDRVRLARATEVETEATMDARVAAGGAVAAGSVTTGTNRSGDEAAEGSESDVRDSVVAAGGGWSIRVPANPVEELLADLLEREKGFLVKMNKEGSNAHDRLWTAAAAAASRGASSPVLSSYTPLCRATAGVAEKGEQTCAVGSAVVKNMPSGSAGVYTGSSAVNLSGASGQQASLPSPPKMGHFPLELSGPGLGDHGAVFTMMVRSAMILGEHETAVLLAVRCVEHLLEVAEVLSSRRGPLSASGGSEGLGSVALLLTTSQKGSGRRERRIVDAATLSACSEFLAHALCVVLWAVPHDERARLFGSSRRSTSGGDTAAAAGVRRPMARRTSVLRCLVRLMRHSMDTGNVRVRGHQISGLVRVFH